MWKDLIVYDILPGRYIINDKGFIIDLTKGWFVKKFELMGYYCCNLQTINESRKSFRIHRLVIATFQPIKLVGKDLVNHKDLNKHNNDINNLEYVTDSENCRHAIRNHARKLVEGEVEPMYLCESNKAGKANGRNSVFAEEQVHQICKMMENNTPYPEILENIGLPADKHLLDILTKIRAKKLWYGISKNYNIPNKEYRSEAIHYDDKTIENICKLICKDVKYRDMANELGIDISNRKDYDKFAHLVRRIKNKKTYSRISDNYF